MTARQRASSGAPWEKRFGYSRAVRAGAHAYVSGTVGRNADGSVPDGAHAQARRALQIVLAALDEVGARPEHVVRTRTFVTDIAFFDDVARAHAEVFGAIRPATSLVAVTALVDPVYLLEIEADAVID
ncbi:MAG: RidA family protein [Candidatus Dormibacteraeota bacterium]|nr:RidA family protein [Candidatus Dormibacteraeota bacterium]MBV9526349.1 RidA family protein [Candidatus Dormibacteraeota bacterium]